MSMLTLAMAAVSMLCATLARTRIVSMSASTRRKSSLSTNQM